MRSLPFVVLGFVVLLAIPPAPVAAGVPCRGTSTVVAIGQGTVGCNPNIAVVCPDGDIGMFRVTVTARDCYGTPCTNSSVTCIIDIATVGRLCVCPDEDFQTGTTDINGQVSYVFDNFGGCCDLHFIAECQGETLGPSNIVWAISPDNNGNCEVNSVDLAWFATKFGTTEPCCDFDCSGAVNAIDLSTFALHFGHTWRR
jgi:hypothetical protein